MTLFGQDANDDSDLIKSIDSRVNHAKNLWMNMFLKKENKAYCFHFKQPRGYG